MAIKVKEVEQEEVVKVVKKSKKVYVTSDDKEFSSKGDAQAHEDKLELLAKLNNLSKDDAELLNMLVEFLKIQTCLKEFDNLSGINLYMWMLKEFGLNIDEIGPYLGYAYWESDGNGNRFFLKNEDDILKVVQEKFDYGYDEGYELNIYDIRDRTELDIKITAINITKSLVI